MGNALFVLQKMEENSTNKIREIKIIHTNAGASIKIPGGWYHETINIGKVPLILVNWLPKETENDYNLIEQKQGFGYYVVESDGGYELLENENYDVIPKPMVIKS